MAEKKVASRQERVIFEIIIRYDMKNYKNRIEIYIINNTIIYYIIEYI